MFFSSYKLKAWFNRHSVNAHLCTFSVAYSFSSSWRVPRDAFRYGGLMYGLLLTIAFVLVALPTTFMQLAIGQMSLQGTVGIWRAVPFFKGVGYIRLLISLVALVYTSVYVAVACTNVFYTISNSVPFWVCQYVLIPGDIDSYIANTTTCFNETLLAPVSEQPEYYVGLSLIVIVLFTVLSFALLGPFKIMKRTFYVLGPVVFVLAIIIVSYVGDGSGLSTFYNHNDIQNMLNPDIWHGALIQALLASQTVNGYLTLAADSIYTNTDIHLTSYTITGVNVIACWLGLMFWYSISYDDGRDTSPFAVLVETYRMAVSRELKTVWPLLIIICLLLSGIVTMFTLLYPVFDHCRRLGSPKWQYMAIACSVASLGGALAAMAGGLTTLSAIEDVIVPLLISIAIIVEMLAFLFIYGRDKIIEDVEFLIGKPMRKYWVVGWFVAPCIVLPLTMWWVAMRLVDDAKWHETPWEAILIVATASMAVLIFVIFAAVSVAIQLEYDVTSKLQASFRPSINWGPRDPIVNYYWLLRKSKRNLKRTRFRRQLAHFSSIASIATISNTVSFKDSHSRDAHFKKRSNSDNWVYTEHRRKYLEEKHPEFNKSNKKRSMSMDYSTVKKPKYVTRIPVGTDFVTKININLS